VITESDLADRIARRLVETSRVRITWDELGPGTREHVRRQAISIIKLLKDEAVLITEFVR
jgi:hypothetical protein